MIQPRSHNAIRPKIGRLAAAARRFAAITFAGLLIVAPALPQSSRAALLRRLRLLRGPLRHPRLPLNRIRAARKKRSRRAAAPNNPATGKRSLPPIPKRRRTIRPAGNIKCCGNTRGFKSFNRSSIRPNARPSPGTFRARARCSLQALDIDPNFMVARERLAELTPSAAEASRGKRPAACWFAPPDRQAGSAGLRLSRHDSGRLRGNRQTIWREDDF